MCVFVCLCVNTWVCAYGIIFYDILSLKELEKGVHKIFNFVVIL